MTLKVTDLIYTCGDFSLRVNLSVEQGEFRCVIGPSGCGKSTLLRLVAGLEPVDSGTLLLAGRDITRIPPEKRGIGLVFQDYALFPHRTVADNVAYGLKLGKAGKKERMARVRDLLSLVRLSEKADVFPATLSGGEQQRVALARAIAPNPSVLLLDEPLSALDARLRVDLRREIREIHDRLSLTTLYVTHDQEEALTLSDRIAVMKDGAILQTGSPKALYENPKDLFTGTFLGLSNTLSGCVKNGWFITDDGIRVTRIGLSEGMGTLFFRPHHVFLHENTAGRGIPFAVKRAEFCGSFTLIHVAAGGHTMVVLDSRKTAWTAGRKGLLEIASDGVLFFPTAS
ncbi:MAG: hypothetical protein CSA22_04255 [Deltaproteobacteria bacterium]|nr:MAG: hypothetical protein CSA22_04255 [Deltaproteobacteria bacterium]